MELLYRGSANQFQKWNNSEDEVSYYNNSILILIKSEEGKCFGSFDSEGAQMLFSPYDFNQRKNSSMFFSIDHETIHQPSYDLKQHDVIDSKLYFGGGAFYLSSYGINSEIRRGKTRLHKSYDSELCETLEKLKISKDDYLAGDRYFKIKEIEIYGEFCERDTSAME